MNQTAEPNNLPQPSKLGPKGIPIESIIEYRRKGLTTREIAAILNCSHTNIVERLQTVSDEIDTLPDYKKHRADILAIRGRRVLNNITNEKLEKATAYQLTGMFGIINQHERLERGESTSNVGFADYTKKISDIDKEIEALEAEVGI